MLLANLRRGELFRVPGDKRVFRARGQCEYEVVEGEEFAVMQVVTGNARMEVEGVQMDLEEYIERAKTGDGE